MTPDQASASIWALVSGFAPKIARARSLLIIQCYVDGSGTGANDMFVMAGYVASAEAWANFSKEWQERLDMRPPLGTFKMSEMAQSPERLERAGWFYSVIEDHVSLALSCALPVQRYRSLVIESGWDKGGEGLLLEPYYYAFHSLMGRAYADLEELGVVAPVDFIFDSEKIRGLPMHPDLWQIVKNTSNPLLRPVIGDIPIFRDDKKVLPLQAADLWAWWIRKWALEGSVSENLRSLNLPWPVRRHTLPRVHTTLDESDVRDFLYQMDKGLLKKKRPDLYDKIVRKEPAGVKMELPDPSSPLSWNKDKP